MGNSSSCDFSSIDKTINDLIFSPPPIDYEQFKKLNSEKSKLLTIKTKKNNYISFVKIEPISEYSKYIIFSHGNASDILGMFPYAEHLCKTYNTCCIFYDYLGYGLSEGKATEEGCYESLDAIVYYLTNDMKIDKKNIILMGQSLGTGVVVHYASINDWNSPIILISPYKTISSVVFDSSFSNPIDKFNSIQKIKKIKCPVKIIHGKKDKLIDISQGKVLYGKLNNKFFEPLWISDADHDNILNKINYEDSLNVINFSI